MGVCGMGVGVSGDGLGQLSLSRQDLLTGEGQVRSSALLGPELRSVETGKLPAGPLYPQHTQTFPAPPNTRLVRPAPRWVNIPTVALACVTQLDIILCTERLLVQFPARAHAQIADPINVFLSLKINKNMFYFFKKGGDRMGQDENEEGCEPGSGSRS